MRRLLIIISMLVMSVIAYAKPPQLAAEQFFDGRYNTEKSVRTTISKENGSYYRGLQVTGNAAIVKKIVEAIAKDSSRAARYFEQTGEGGKSILMKISNNGETIDICIQQNTEGTNAYFFIKGPEKAFK